MRPRTSGRPKGDILLKLRKVEIVGFKSFCDRTVVTFSGSGTTCIVGPNGCGKSNVVDAISWVLGEQSHKSLRAERMADCIFNGTTKRPPMGLAEATITLEDPELAEAARFVLESAASELTSETQLNTDAVTTPEMEETPAPSEQASQGGAEPAAAVQDQARWSSAPGPPKFLSDQKFRKAKGRKKGAKKPVLAMRPGEVVVSRRL